MVVPALSFVTLVVLGLPVWTYARNSGASQQVSQKIGQRSLAPRNISAVPPAALPAPPPAGPSPTNVAAPVSPAPSLSVETPPSSSLLSRWEAERAMMKRKLAAREGLRDRHRRKPLRLASRASDSGREFAAIVEAQATSSPTAPDPATRQARGVTAGGRRPGTLPPGLVRKVVWSHAAEVQSCFDRAAMEHLDLRGRLFIRATVDREGRVVALSPTTDIENGNRLRACVVSAFQSWSFPAPDGDGPAEISYAFSFD